MMILPICNCAEHPAPHVHLPDMVDSQFSLPVVAIPKGPCKEGCQFKGSHMDGKHTYPCRPPPRITVPEPGQFVEKTGVGQPLVRVGGLVYVPQGCSDDHCSEPCGTDFPHKVCEHTGVSCKGV